MADEQRIQIVVPTGSFGASDSEAPIDAFLRRLALAIEGDDGNWCSKYGTDYENEVFLMRRFCWCEDDACPWCLGCRCPPENWSGDRKVRWTCDYCTGSGILARFAPWSIDRERHYYDPPLFWYKPSDFRLTWYKFIGRDTATNRDLPPEELATIIDHCLRSI